MSNKAVLKRRTLLRNLGAAAFLATPIFRAVISEAQSTFPLRLILLNLPGGVPGTERNDRLELFTTFDQMYKPFADLQSDMIIFDHLDNKAGDLVATYFELEGHGGGCRSMFGGAVRDQGCGGPNISCEESNAYRYGTATTIDQTLADAIGGRTQLPFALMGSLWDRGQGGDHAECHYKNGQAVRPMSNPMTAFTRIFGNGLPTGSPAPSPSPEPAPEQPTGPDPAAVALYERGRSRLDLLLAEMAEIKAIAGSDEQQKLDQHLTALRELEARLVNPSGSPGGGVVGGSVPVKPGAGCALPQNYNNNGSDLQAASAAFNELAYQTLNCDLSRIVGLQWLSSGDHIPRFQFLGLSGDHHGMEHSGDGSEYTRAQLWIFEEMAKFIRLLKNTPEGNGSMLDNSIVYLGSEMGNGTHVLSPTVSTIFGKAGGAFNTGRRMDMSGRNLNDVLTTVVRTMGLNANYVGDPEFNSAPAVLG